jgi:1,4-dihydroxy-2-naphthoate octaprenyltransferase
MSQSLCSILKTIASIILSGISIKMFDDFIDENNRNYIPYILCFLCVSVALWNESSSLFLCSYIVGMFHDENLKLISGLRSYHEQFLAFTVSILLSGFIPSLSSLCIICTIQLLDDLVDANVDKIACKRNLAVKIGIVETIIIMFIFFILSMFLDSAKTLICIPSAIMISFIFNNAVRKGG